MSKLSNEILNILLKNDIKPEDINTELYKIQQEINESLWEKINISSTIFYKLKDTIFLNFEHLINTDVVTGRSNMKYYGTKYPVFLLGISSNYISKDFVESIIIELEDVKSKWNNQIYSANLYSKQDFDWKIGDENPSSLIIYNKDSESPSKYGYYNNSDNGFSKIYNIEGDLFKKNNNIILCAINKIDIYREYNILSQTLDKLYNAFIKAKNSNKGVYLDFDNYNYEY